MPASITIDAMEARVRELSNQEANSGAGDLCTQAEIFKRLNEALAELYDKLIAAYPPEHYATEAVEVSTVVGTNGYNLEAKFYKLLRAYLVDSSNNYYDLEQWSFTDLTDLKRRQAQGQATAPWQCLYRIQNNQIVLRPAPQVTTWKLGYFYIPSFTYLTTGQSFDGVNGWEQWAILEAAIYCMNKEETDPSILLAMQAKETARIEALAVTRDMSNPVVVEDVMGNTEYISKYTRNKAKYRYFP